MAARQHISVEIKGSLDFEEESSDDEALPQEHAMENLNTDKRSILLQQDENEELEVFNIESKLPLVSQNKDVQYNPLPPAPPAHEEGGSRKLIDLMAASVAKHTGEAETDPNPTSKVTIQFPASSARSQEVQSRNTHESVVSELKDIESDSEAFGITYKPYKKEIAYGNNGYKIPGAEEHDEDLRFSVTPKSENVATNLGRCGKGVAEEADDDFDIGLSASSPESSLSIVQLANKAAEREKEEESAILASLASEMGEIARGESTGVNMAVVSGNPSTKYSEEATFTLQDAVTEGYDSISRMYEPGAAGDTDVRAELSHEVSMDGNAGVEKTSKVKTEVPDRNQADAKAAIIEEGEDEEESDEDDEARIVGQISSDRKKELISLSKAIEEFDAAIPLTSTNGISAGDNGDPTTARKRFLPATYDDTLAYMQGLDLSLYEASINPFEPRSGAGKSLMTIMGLKTDNRKVEPLQVSVEGWKTDELLRWPFLIAKKDYDPSEPRELLILQSIYRALMGKHGTDENVNTGHNPYVPATGAHWEAIGFQGNDPCTDINRAIKLFALLQALHFIMKYGQIAKQAHYLSSLVSEHKDNSTGRDLSWPFMCVSISFSKEAIVAFRTGELNSICNEKNSVLDVLHAFHRACFDKFCALLCEDPLTHHAVHLSSVKTACANRPAKFLRAYWKEPAFKGRHSSSYASKSESLGFSSSTESDAEFIDLENVTQNTDTDGVDEAGEAAARQLSQHSKAKKFQI